MSPDQDTGKSLRLLYAGEGGVRSVFGKKAADYAASRPDYPAALFETLKMKCPPREDVLVADIGSGTGLLTHGLLQNGYRVTAIEPNPEMRQMSDLRLGHIPAYRSTDGCAESIPLLPASVHLITAAQAFHWFEIEKARVEFLRVLAPQGRVALIWNERLRQDPLHAALDEAFAEFGGAKQAALVAHEDRSKVPGFFGATQSEQFMWPHAHHLDRAGLASLVFSRSYIPNRNTPDGSAVVARVNKIFDRFAANETVEVRYQTVATIGRPT